MKDLKLEDLVIGECYKYDDLTQLVFNDEQLSFEEFGKEVIGFLIL